MLRGRRPREKRITCSRPTGAEQGRNAAPAHLAKPRRDRYGISGGGVVMRLETQLSVFLENRAGVLAELAADLARHGISIRGLTVANLADHAVVRLVVSEPQKALHLLGDRGVLVVTSQVLAIDMPDEAGSPPTRTNCRRLGGPTHTMTAGPPAPSRPPR